MDISRFLTVYANLPIGIRNEIVVVMDKEGPMTWNAAWVEIQSGTELGKEIYTKLTQMGVI